MEVPEIIDMTSHGPVIELSYGGYADFSSALQSTLHDLFTLGTPLPKWQKVRILGSKIFYSGGIHRCNIEKVYTFGYLYRLHTKLCGTTFEIESYEKQCGYDFENMAKRAEGRAAWGAYSNFIHLSKLADIQKKLDTLRPEERAVEEKRLKKENRFRMFIG